MPNRLSYLASMKFGLESPADLWEQRRLLRGVAVAGAQC
jgi:hypothetical protein